MLSQALQPGPEILGAVYLEQFEEIAPSIEPDGETFSPQSSPTRCGSITADFGPGTGQLVYPDVARRMSFMSSTSLSPSWASTAATPITPISVKDEQIAIDDCRQNPEIAACHITEDIFRMQEPSSWPENIEMDEQFLLQASMLFDEHLQPVRQPTHSSHFQELPQLDSNKSNPSLTRSVFLPQDQSTDMVNELEAESNMWMLFANPISPPTITPSETFQSAYITSPTAKLEPSTPVRSQLRSSIQMSSSSFETVSPPIVPSQNDISDEYSDMDEYSISPLPRRSRSTTDRLHRRSYERRQKVGCPSKSVTSRSGIECDEVIAHNEYTCSQFGCQKRFKRQEHRKRHELTVHDKKKSFKCWVPGCKTAAFTRTDNLKSHQKNTHGTKKATQRNRYVATLDEKSKYYDPTWIGDLTDEGIPIRPRKAQL